MNTYLEERFYLKPGIWVSLVAHLFLFLGLFLWGSQRFSSKEEFVELAEFNLAMPIKEVASEQAGNPPKTAIPQKQLSAPPAPIVPKSQPPFTVPKPLPPLAEVQDVAATNKSSTPSAISEQVAEAKTDQRDQGDASAVVLPEKPQVNAEKRLRIAATSSANSNANNKDNLTGWGKYGRQLSIEASRYKKYPALAQSGHMQGTVIVVVNVLQSGEVSVGVGRSSGFEVLDKQALGMVKQAVKNVAIPGELKNVSKELFVPIQFEM